MFWNTSIEGVVLNVITLHYVEGALVRSEIIPNDVIPIVVTLTSVIELNKLD